jgi:O-antigen/teichoic acid export membrane protein
MQNQSANTKRIAKNTMMLYVRMLFGMLVSLYTSRVVLSTLGVEDFGIQGAVGGFVAMFSLISSSLSSSVSRFLTFELGKGDKESLKQVFSTSLLIHIALAIIVFLCIETFGVWFLNNRMDNIPVDRLYAANWLLQFSVVSFMLGLISVPYNASLISHEKMDVFAMVGIVDIVMKLFIVLSLKILPVSADKLIIYALMGMCWGVAL